MFLVFEGIDGAGKSTQARLLKEYLESQYGCQVLLVREPGGTELGEKVRQLLLDPHSGDLAAEVEMFLFMAARAHLCRTRISPALQRGEVVISDRFTWSTVVYQGFVGGLDPGDVLRLGRIATPGLEPTYTFVIDLPPEEAFQRLDEQDRMERKGLGFQRRVRQGFLSLAAEHPASCAVVDGRGAAREVAERVIRSLPAAGRGVQWTSRREA
jgi:dTMP kinase